MNYEEMPQMHAENMEVSHKKTPSSREVIRDSEESVAQPDRALPGREVTA